jgi:hypothetical protein
MAADSNLNINPLSHIEGLASIKERVVRRKKQQQQKGTRHDTGETDEQIEDEFDELENDMQDDDEHIDFKA